MKFQNCFLLLFVSSYILAAGCATPMTSIAVDLKPSLAERIGKLKEGQKREAVDRILNPVKIVATERDAYLRHEEYWISDSCAIVLLFSIGSDPGGPNDVLLNPGEAIVFRVNGKQSYFLQINISGIRVTTIDESP